jgi:predicted ATPase
MAFVAGACEAAGRPTAARGHLDIGLEAARRSGEHWFESELHRMPGEWLLRHTPQAQDEAETHFRTAVELAEEQGAILWECRAAASMARLHDD